MRRVSEIGFLTALGCTGCLVTTEYGLEDEPQRVEPAPEPSAMSERECDEDARSCVGRELLRCGLGEWKLVERCDADTTCSVVLGRCARCEPGIEHACNKGRLERCREDGAGYELLEDCAAAGKLCDVELSYDRCLDCRGTDQQCGEAVLERCVEGHFVDAGACEFGACRVVDGRSDYCPECPQPGREACGVQSRVVCSRSLQFEELEECPNGCGFDGGVTHCL